MVRRIERRPQATETDVSLSKGFSDEALPYKPPDSLIVDNIPFYTYYALNDGAPYVLHPMRMGTYLLRNVTSTRAKEIMANIVDIAFELPNGGLAWYYPRHYRVNRMLGKNLKYSSISH